MLAINGLTSFVGDECSLSPSLTASASASLLGEVGSRVDQKPVSEALDEEATLADELSDKAAPRGNNSPSFVRVALPLRLVPLPEMGDKIEVVRIVASSFDEPSEL